MLDQGFEAPARNHVCPFPKRLLLLQLLLELVLALFEFFVKLRLIFGLLVFSWRALLRNLRRDRDRYRIIIVGLGTNPGHVMKVVERVNRHHNRRIAARSLQSSASSNIDER